MSRELFLIAPSRDIGNKSTLYSEQVLKNLFFGVETSIVFDLNVLNYMKDVLAFDSHGFFGPHSPPFFYLLDILTTNGVFIVPGFALTEADTSYRDILVTAYEEFVEKYAPTFVNAHNHVEYSGDKKSSRIFNLLSESEQLLCAVSYVAMLKIYQIKCDLKKSTGFAKFDEFLEYMGNSVNMVPAFETEVAKFCLFGDKTGCNEFDEFSKVIVDNFSKTGSGEGKLKSLLNQSRDLMYLRICGLMCDYAVDGYPQDCRLITLDKGLFYLSQTIHFCPQEGYNAKYVYTESTLARDKSSYWRYVDHHFEALVERRLRDGVSTNDYHASDEHLREIVKLTKELESWVLEDSKA